MSLSPLAILKHSSKLSGANLVGLALGFPLNILIARQVGPSGLAIIGYVGVWQLYITLCKPSIFGAGYREIPPLLAQGRLAEAVRLQNIGLAAEGIFPLLGAGVMIGWALFQPAADLRTGLILGAVALVLSQAQGFASMLQGAYRRFGLLARARLWAELVSSAFVLVALWRFGIYAVLLSSGVAGVTALLFYWVGAPRLGWRLQWDTAEIWRLAKIGMPLALGGLFYWGFRNVDRSAVMLALPLVELGYFTFAMQFVTAASALVADFHTVMQPLLWTDLAEARDLRDVAPRAQHLCLQLLAVTCAGASLAQAAFGAFVVIVVPAFGPAVPVFEVLVFHFVFAALSIIPNEVLQSARVNRQVSVSVLYGAGLALNVALAYLAVQMHWGLQGIALVSVIANGLSCAGSFSLAARYLRRGHGDLYFYGSVAALLALVVAMLMVMRGTALAYAAPAGNPLAQGALRLAFVGGIWAVVWSLSHLRRTESR